MIWEKFNEFWKAHRGKIFFVLFLIEFFLIYALIPKVVGGQRTLLLSGVDNNIPFIPAFILAYLLFIPILFFCFISVKDREDFYHLSLVLFIAATITSLFFIILPSFMVRPVLGPENIFNKLILFIYGIDSAYNTFPSSHVTYSLLATLALFNINKKRAKIILPFTILTIISTVFIKQHYFVDLIGGIALALLCYLFIFKKYRKGLEEIK